MWEKGLSTVLWRALMYPPNHVLYRVVDEWCLRHEKADDAHFWAEEAA